jgi:hypothetical protein
MQLNSVWREINASHPGPNFLSRYHRLALPHLHRDRTGPVLARSVAAENGMSLAGVAVGLERVVAGEVEEVEEVAAAAEQTVELHHVVENVN